MPDLTELQKQILQEKRDHPDWSGKKIAQEVDCSPEYAREVLRDYDTALLDEVEIETSENSSSSSPGILEILFIWPLKLAIGLTVLMMKVTVGLMLLPFKLLFGDSGD